MCGRLLQAVNWATKLAGMPLLPLGKVGEAGRVASVAAPGALPSWLPAGSCQALSLIVNVYWSSGSGWAKIGCTVAVAG